MRIVADTMPLDRLHFTGLRNLMRAELRPSPGINLISGANGSGKTSLLEGLHLLGLARSFRARQLKTLIHFDCDALTVFGRLQGDPPIPLGLERRRDADTPVMKLAGERIERVSQLAERLPLQLIDSRTFELVEGSPKARREYLDWGVFHVEQAFLDCWKRMRRALKHRNALLRHGRIDRLSIDAWNQELAREAQRLDGMREAYVARLEPLFMATLARLAELPELSLGYYRGWDRSRPLGEILEASVETDRQMGFTQQGPQRADLRLKVGRRPAAEVLSRGQQKVVVSALKLAQGQLLEALTEHHCLYLIDDLAAELDLEHRRRFCELLEEQRGQSFITVIERDTLGYRFTTEVKAFEVRAGQVSEA
nr:DNA replication/repair protein RecF [Halotalea alkalilenta]